MTTAANPPAAAVRPARRRLPLHGPALAGLVVLAVLIALAVLTPWIAPHDPEAVDPEPDPQAAERVLPVRH